MKSYFSKTSFLRRITTVVLLSVAAFLGIITVSAQEKQTGGNLFLNMFAALPANSGSQSSTSSVSEFYLPDRNGEFAPYISNYELNFNLIGESAGSKKVVVDDGTAKTLYVLAGNDFTIEAHLVSGEQFPDNLTWTLTKNDKNNNQNENGLILKPESTQTKKIYQANPAYEFGTYTITVKGSNSNKNNVTRTMKIVVVTLNLKVVNPVLPDTPKPGYDSILVTNIADESGKGKPDYANFENRENETSIIKANLSVNFGDLSKSDYKVKITYDGATTISNSYAKIKSNNKILKDIFGRKDEDVYYNYTLFKTQGKNLRIWTSSQKKYTTNRVWTSTYPINQPGDERKISKYPKGNYLAPAMYAMADLFPENTSPFGSKDLYLEGINPCSGTKYSEVTVTLVHEIQNENGNSVEELVSNSIKLNIIEGNIILNVNNDSQYCLDENDIKIKDQHGGFKGWFAKELYGANVQNSQTTYELENLFPVLLKDLSPLPKGMRYILKVNHEGALLEHPCKPEDGAKVLDYLRNGKEIDKLYEKYFKPIYKYSTGPATFVQSYPTFYNTMVFEASQTDKIDKLFLFGVYQTANETTCKNYLSLCVCRENSEDVLLTLDRALYTITPIDKFFEVWSTREKEPNTEFNYPNDPPYTTQQFKTFKDAECLDEKRAGEELGEVTFAKEEDRDPNKDVLIFLHGFNVNLKEGFDFHRPIFRRLYWSGYRGNYIGWCWTGNDIGSGKGKVDESLWNTFNVSEKYRDWFDTNVFRALQSSRSLCKFIEVNLTNCKQINLAAHSLGNLVMWDALRLHTYRPFDKDKSTPIKKIENVISIEGAVWSEAFRPPKFLAYKNELVEQYKIVYPSLTSDVELREIEGMGIKTLGSFLEKHSWSHWFRTYQYNLPDNSHDVFSIVEKFVNSRTEADSVLFYMKKWNTLCSGQYDHYNRNVTPDKEFSAFRSPRRDSLPEMSALLKPGQRSPFDSGLDPQPRIDNHFRLFDPIGLANINDVTEIDKKNIIDYNVNAPGSNSGWRRDAHNDMKNVLFGTIYEWYRTTFSEYSTIIKP